MSGKNRYHARPWAPPIASASASSHKLAGRIKYDTGNYRQNARINSGLSEK
jgi:hypothetical protein